MTNFDVTFTRYGDGTRHISAQHNVRAQSFKEAYAQAETMLRGMISVDPEREYSIVSVDGGRNFAPSAIRCGDLPNALWSTPDQYEAWKTENAA